MLGKLRGFTNSKLAGILVAIIIVPFVFWGMGSVFSGGNTNNIAKINNNSISTKDFINHINRSRINPDYIKENLCRFVNLILVIYLKLLHLNLYTPLTLNLLI